MGIKPSPKGHLQPEKSLPVNASRNMYKNKLLTSPKDIKGLQVDDHDLDSILENMAVSLPAEELNDLTLTPPVDANGKFGVNILTDGMDGVKAITGKVDINDMKKVPGNVGRELKDNKYEALVNNLPINGGKVNVSNVDSILGDMRIKLPQKEREKLTENLLLNANGKVELGTLMDAVTNVTGGEVNVSDIESILEKTGIELTDKECLELKKYLPVDAVGKVYQNRVMDGLKTLKGGIVDVAKLDTALQSMGMKLTGMESNDLIKNLPVDDNGKIKMKKLMDALNAFSGKKIDANDLLEVLGNMGIELTEEEFLKLKQIVPIDAAGKVYQKRLLDGVKSLKEGMVKANDLDNVLENLGIELTEMEHEDLTEYLPPDANGKIGLKNVIEAVEAVTGGEVDVSDVGNVLEDMGVTVTDKECGELVKNLPVNANGKVYKNRLLDGLKSLHGKQIDANDLLEVLENMGIELTEEEFVKLKQTVPIDAAGKVYQKRLLDGVKSLKGGMVKANNLDNVLENLGIELTEKEREDLTENLPPDANGKIGFKNVMEAMETVTGGEVDVSDVGNVLEDMGVTVTDKEYGELVKNLPVNADGKVYKNRLLDGLKSLHGGVVNVNKLDSVLRTMGWKLTEDEIKDLKCNIPTDVYGRVAMKKLFDGLKATKGKKMNVHHVPDFVSNLGVELTDKENKRLLKKLPVDASGKFSQNRLLDNQKSFIGKKIDANDLLEVLGNMGIELTEEEFVKLKKIVPIDAAGKVYQKRLLDGVKLLKGGMVKANNLDNVLENLGIELMEKEHEDLTEYLPPDANGKIGLKNLMEAVETVTGGEVDVSDVGNVLGNMGVTITDKECGELVKNLPVNANGKVYKSRLLDGLKSLHGKNIDVNDLLEVLGNMGIELTEEEFVKLKQTVPIDAAGKVYQKRLLDGVKSLKGGMVKANNLDNVLENLGIELTEKEREDLTEYLPPDENGKIGLKNVMEAVETVTGGEVDVSDVGNVLEDMGVTVTDKECGELVKNLPVNADGKVYKNRLLDGLKSLHGGVVNVNKLDSVLRTMGWKLTEDEIKDLKCNLPTDVYGRVAMRKLFDGLKATKGKKMSVQHVPDFVSNLGVELTDKENKRLLKKLPVDASGKIYQNRLLDNLKSFTGGKVERSKVNTVLENMGLELTGKEIQSLTDNLSVDGNGKVDFDKLMDGVKALTGEKLILA
ncbi:uncharacterized protein LOC131816702 [Mustela lutreola]|nr:uncharacterized protein LOC131816702 [Mustela lutreola]